MQGKGIKATRQKQKADSNNKQNKIKEKV